MPAVLTHDFFGKDIYAHNASALGKSPDEKQAFLLGNQGPDPLFYLVVSPSMKQFFSLGSDMHRTDASALLAAFKECIGLLDNAEQAIGRAFAAGFLCHYALDRAMHPFVYSQQFAICDAGIEGLSRADETEVHGEIEREFDEMVLYAKTGLTIRSYKPFAEVLKASDAVLNTIGKMIAFASMKAMRVFPPVELYPQAVKNFRLVQKFFYSPRGVVGSVAQAAETRLLGRNFSFYKAMAHRDNPCATSAFDNREHSVWENPFTHDLRTDGFWDIYGATQAEVPLMIEAFLSDSFDEQAARALTGGIDFSGNPVACSQPAAEAARNDKTPLQSAACACGVHAE